MKLKIKIVPFFSLIIIQLFISCNNSGYKKIDGKWAYVIYDEGRGKRVRNINVNNQNFTIINKDYAKDNLLVFYKGRVIENADSKSFKVIKDGYSKDKNNIYLYWYPLINVNPNKFKILEGFFSKDDKNIYCGTVPLILADISSFKVMKVNKRIVTISSKEFIKKHPEYSFINTEKYKIVVYCNSIGKSNTGVFEGVRKID